MAGRVDPKTETNFDMCTHLSLRVSYKIQVSLGVDWKKLSVGMPE